MKGVLRYYSIALVIFLLTVVVTVSAVNPPWCDYTSVKYYIWSGLDRTADSEGWYDLLNTYTVVNAANSWNNARADAQPKWPYLSRTVYSSYHIYFYVESLDGKDGKLGFWYKDSSSGKNYIGVDLDDLRERTFIDNKHVLSVVAHEFGHALEGPYHTSYYCSLMYYGSNYEDTGIYKPTSVDIEFMETIYDDLCKGGVGDCGGNDPDCALPSSPFNR